MSRSRSTTSRAAPDGRMFPWPLELDAELCATDRCKVTDEQLRSLSALLNEADGVHLATAEAYEHINLVRVYLTVDAEDSYDAHDRVCALVHDCLNRVGLGPAILVAVRPGARHPASGRRMA